MLDLAGLLIANIIPLYILIALGFISGRFLEVNLPSMATISVYVLAPVVNFGAMAQMEFTPEYIILPLLVLAIVTIISTLSYKSGQIFWRSNMANLIGMGGGTANTMYFGLPIVLALLGPEWVGVYALMNLGIIFNEVVLGYFFGARGHHGIKDALIKVLKLPVIHSIWIGLLYNLSGFALPDIFLKYWDYSIGAWVIIGMMLIGVALSKQSRLDIDLRLIANMFVPKFILWPLLAFGVILSDATFFQLFGQEIYLMLAIMAGAPLAGNFVAYAATLNLYPEKAAATVLLSTLIAFITVPAAVLLVQMLS